VRLKDPAEVVSKTAKKLLLELHKCYPQSFESKFIATLPASEDRAVCSLILQDKFEEAQRLLNNSALSISGSQIQTNIPTANVA
jgi:hypothetical protein